MQQIVEWSINPRPKINEATARWLLEGLRRWEEKDRKEERRKQEANARFWRDLSALLERERQAEAAKESRRFLASQPPERRAYWLRRMDSRGICRADAPFC